MRFGLAARFGWAAAALALAAPGGAQIRTVDPSSQSVAEQRTTAPSTPIATEEPEPVVPGEDPVAPPPASAAPAPAPQPAGAEARAKSASGEATYADGDILEAAENTFGKGAEGLAKIIERTLKEQGRPTAYIAGREAGGAIAVGLRYGSGTLFHKVEGDSPVYWTGPSLGFDIGANGSKTFVLVYNLYDSAELYHRFPAAEGTLYVVGGFTASYLRRGDIVLIPIRLGVGWRAGVNVGYMRFSKKSRISPF
jgi:hypothetical protein